MSSPSTNGSNGRGTNGRFTRGNAFGKGNPHSRRVAKLRSALLETVSEADVIEIVRDLVSRAKEGNFGATRIVLPYLVGKPGEWLSQDDHGALVTDEDLLEAMTPEEREELERVQETISRAFETAMVERAA